MRFGRMLVAVLVVMLLASTAAAAQKEAFVFGVHPFKKPVKLAKMFKPITDHVAAVTGKEVKLVVSKSYAELEQMYRSGQVDFGYMGPSLYAKVGQDLGVEPLARIMVKGKGTFQGVVVVKKDSPVESLAELKGRSFVFGDPNSTLSHYVPHHMLMEAGVRTTDLEKFAFVGSHDNVAINVLNGNFIAGGLKPAVARQYLDKGLRILAESKPVPEHLFVASGQLDEATRQQLKEALFQADGTALKAVKGSISGLEEARYGDYLELKALMDDVDRNDPVTQ